MNDLIISTRDISTARQPAQAEGEDWATETELHIRDCSVPAELHGARADKLLACLLPEFSRSYLQQLIVAGAVGLSGKPLLKPATRVSVGQILRIELRPIAQTMAFMPQAMALNVVYEDTDLLVIHKPAGLVVHPAPGHWSGTLLNGLLAHHATAVNLPRAGIVHRLDKDTSGLMLVAKNLQAMDGLVRAIAAREVNREYLALAHGSWHLTPQVLVDQPVGRDPNNRLRMAAFQRTACSGKPAQTTVHLISSNANYSLLRCQLHTGRTHQIRVHMAWLGHPLVADATYGGRLVLGLKRQALHAIHLRLTHPVSGSSLAFSVPPPADFLEGLLQAQLRYN